VVVRSQQQATSEPSRREALLAAATVAAAFTSATPAHAIFGLGGSGDEEVYQKSTVSTCAFSFRKEGGCMLSRSGLPRVYGVYFGDIAYGMNALAGKAGPHDRPSQNNSGLPGSHDQLDAELNACTPGVPFPPIPAERDCPGHALRHRPARR
jgi:hypothetical protein